MPVDDVVDDSEDNAVTVNGTTTNVEDGQTVTVNIDGTDYTTTVTGNAWSITGIDLSTLPDGVSYNVTANVDDAAGNAAPSCHTSDYLNGYNCAHNQH